MRRGKLSAPYFHGRAQPAKIIHTAELCKYGWDLWITMTVRLCSTFLRANRSGRGKNRAFRTPLICPVRFRNNLTNAGL